MRVCRGCGLERRGGGVGGGYGGTLVEQFFVTVMCGAETWSIRMDKRGKLCVMEMKCLQSM